MSFPLYQAKELAIQLRDLLEPACEQIEVAGSIRRNQQQVSDIEIVCEPRLIDNPNQLFATQQVSMINIRVKTLLELSDRLTLDPDRKCNGSRQKRLLFEGVPVDLFCVLPPAQWGSILAIRTGPGDFNRLLMTERERGGAMPIGFEHSDGHLVRRCGGILEPVATPTEAEFFRVLGVPHIAPAERTEMNLRRILRKQQTASPWRSRR